MAFEFNYEIPAFGRSVTVRTRLGGKVVEHMVWKDLPWKLITKWEWYFRYRAALAQVKYPRYDVDYQRWSYKPEGRTKDRIEYDNNKRKLTTAKRMVTKITNGLAEYKKEELKKLLPDLENDHYLEGVMKLEKYKLKVEVLTKKIDNDRNRILK